MNEKSPSDVVRDLFALMEEERWSEIPAAFEPGWLQQAWEERIEEMRPSAERVAITVEHLTSHSPEMPLEVAQWNVDRMNAQAGEPRFGDVAGVTSAAELERLTPAELLARRFQANDHRYQMKTEILQSHPQLAEEDFSEHALRRVVIGEVVDKNTAYTVFREHYSQDRSGGEIKVAPLTRTPAGWKLQTDAPFFSHMLYSVSVAETPEFERAKLPTVAQVAWTSRTFEHKLTLNQFPAVLERFRGASARVSEAGAQLRTVRTAKPDGKWSIQEHLGHLIDLEELGEQRLQDYIARAPALSAADMTNQKTDRGDHNSAEWWELAERFRIARETLCRKLESLPPEVIAHTAQHPRLKRPMNVPEWVFFMCEHDDHHMQRMRELSIVLSQPPQSLT
ncbi:MAG: DinB family protein [Gemmatimonadota bacterium]